MNIFTILYMKKIILLITCFLVPLAVFTQRAARNLVVIEIGTGTW